MDKFNWSCLIILQKFYKCLIMCYTEIALNNNCLFDLQSWAVAWLMMNLVLMEKLFYIVHTYYTYTYVYMYFLGKWIQVNYKREICDKYMYIPIMLENYITDLSLFKILIISYTVVTNLNLVIITIHNCPNFSTLSMKLLWIQISSEVKFTCSSKNFQKFVNILCLFFFI